MITRLHGASSTLVANPRRRRRNPTQGELTLVAPSPNKRTRKPLSAAKKKAAMHKRVRAKIPEGAHAIAFLNTVSGERTNKKGKVVKYRSLSASKKLGETKPKFTLYSSGKGKERVMGIVKNPKKRRKHHNPMPAHLARALAKRRAHKRHNPMLEIAGVPVIEMAVGSVGAIAAAAAIQGFLDKQSFMANLPAAVKDYKLDKAIAPAAVAAVSAFAYKKMSGTGKDIAKYAFIGSVFVAIQEVVGGKVKELVSGAAAPSASAPAASTTPAKNGLHGIYVDPYGGKPAVGGMYMKAANGMNGMYLSANGTAQADMGGLGLYQAKSIYG